jgi:hypothetical protein
MDPHGIASALNSGIADAVAPDTGDLSFGESAQLNVADPGLA